MTGNFTVPHGRFSPHLRPVSISGVEEISISRSPRLLSGNDISRVIFPRVTIPTTVWFASSENRAETISAFRFLRGATVNSRLLALTTRESLVSIGGLYCLAFSYRVFIGCRPRFSGRWDRNGPEGGIPPRGDSCHVPLRHSRLSLEPPIARGGS